MIKDSNISNVIWGRVKYKWKNPQTYILLQEKITVYSDKPSESEWVPVDFGNKNMKQNTKYLVGHYIIFGPHRGKEFHVDYTHDDMESAMEDWKHLCEVLPDSEVEIRKQTTETIVARELDNEETMAQSWN